MIANWNLHKICLFFHIVCILRFADPYLLFFPRASVGSLLLMMQGYPPPLYDIDRKRKHPLQKQLCIILLWAPLQSSIGSLKYLGVAHPTLKRLANFFLLPCESASVVPKRVIVLLTWIILRFLGPPRGVFIFNKLLLI